jgi:hypothetical protein
MTYLIGADPELFLKKNNRFISVEDNNGPLIPGNKKSPYKVDGGAIQVDGVAAEFNINPSDNFNSFYKNIKDVVSCMRERLKNKDPEITLSATPTATFDRDYFFNLPKHTLELGCEPDYNAYNNGEPNPRPQTTEPFRTGSGHIHIGWTNGMDPFSRGNMLDCCLVVKQLDKYLLKASLDWDTDNRRRKLYGAPGSFRPKSYGVEYRPASNAWLNSPISVQAVFYITLGVMRSVEKASFNLDADISYVDTVDASKPYARTNRILARFSNVLPEIYK